MKNICRSVDVSCLCPIQCHAAALLEQSEGTATLDCVLLTRLADGSAQCVILRWFSGKSLNDERVSSRSLTSSNTSTSRASSVACSAWIVRCWCERCGRRAMIYSRIASASVNCVLKTSFTYNKCAILVLFLKFKLPF